MFVLRPTWHFVLPEDIRWLLALTAPRVIASMAGRQRQLELDSGTITRSQIAFTKAMRGGRTCTLFPSVSPPCRCSPRSR